MLKCKHSKDRHNSNNDYYIISWDPQITSRIPLLYSFIGEEAEAKICTKLPRIKR